jgi:hypothetical protein
MDGRGSRAFARCRSYAMPPGDLTEQTVTAMWEIFRRYYEIEDRTQFVDSLAEKDVVFLVEDSASRRLVGFTSVLVMHFDGYRALHSGDTMLEPEYWGAGKHFSYHMAKLLTRLYLSKPGTPLYWFLISQGHRTYLMMARNMTRFYPTWRSPTPPWAMDVIEEVARHRYGTAFQRESGLLTFPYRRKPLRSWVAPVTDEDLRDPDIAYFVRSNPGWDGGDELGCLGVVDFRLLVRSWLKVTAVRARSLLAGRSPVRPSGR